MCSINKKEGAASRLHLLFIAGLDTNSSFLFLHSSETMDHHSHTIQSLSYEGRNILNNCKVFPAFSFLFQNPYNDQHRLLAISYRIDNEHDVFGYIHLDGVIMFAYAHSVNIYNAAFLTCNILEECHCFIFFII